MNIGSFVFAGRATGNPDPYWFVSCSPILFENDSGATTSTLDEINDFSYVARVCRHPSTPVLQSPIDSGFAGVCTHPSTLGLQRVCRHPTLGLQTPDLSRGFAHISITLSLGESGHVAGATHCAAKSRQDESFNFAPQVIGARVGRLDRLHFGPPRGSEVDAMVNHALDEFAGV